MEYDVFKSLENHVACEKDYFNQLTNAINQPFLSYKYSSNFERTYQKLNLKPKPISEKEEVQEKNFEKLKEEFLAEKRRIALEKKKAI